MKRIVLVALVLATAIPAQAQLFGGRNSIGGAILGGIAGGVIGHNNGRKTAEGVAIGAGAGLLLGAIADRNQSDRAYYGYSSGPAYSPSYGHSYRSYGYAPYRHGYHSRSYGYGAPTYYRPSYATSGAVLGGIAGGIIGHNNGRQTAEGIAIGAGAGLVLGAIADHNRPRATYAPAPVYVSPSTRYGYEPTVTYSQPESAPAPTQVTIINNNYYGNATPMSGANGLFGR